MGKAGLWAVAAMVSAIGAAGPAFSQCYYIRGEGVSEDCDSEVQGGESAATQSQSVSAAIGSQISARFGADHDVASQADDEPSTYTAYWISAAGRRYSGDSEGWQAETVGGIDFYLGDRTLAGAFLGYGKSSRDSNFTQNTGIAATVGGVYLAHLYGESTILHLFLGGGSAQYEADGGRADASRFLAGIDVSWEIDRGGKTVFVPYGKLIVASDEVPEYTGNSGDHPEATIVGRTVTVGGRVEYKEPLKGTEFLPYLSLGVDYVQITPGNFLPDTETVAPRAEAGFTGPLGEGLLTLDLHAAKADGGTSDVGGALTYSFGF